MEKNEIKKILIMESNALKGINNLSDKKNEEELIDDKKKAYIGLIILNSVCVCLFGEFLIDSYFDEHYYMMPLEIFCIIDSLLKIRNNLKKIGVDVLPNEEEDLKSYSFDTKINNINNAIEFIDSLTKEEQEKYLKLKI